MKVIFLLQLLLMSFSLFSKTILVTGGVGFIGSHVVEQLLDRGDEVIIVDNFYGSNELIAIKEQYFEEIKIHDKNQSLLLYRYNICDAKEMKHIFDSHQIDVVCHLAARAGVRDSIVLLTEYIDTNLLGTAIIFDLARQYKVSHVVFASSSSVYGERHDNNLFDEADRTDSQVSPYGMTKKAGELLASVFYHLYNLPITCLRFFTVYGPRGRRDMAPFIFMDSIYNEKQITVYGDGFAIRDFTYVDDIVDGIIKAIDTPLTFEIVNLGKGEPVSIRYFLEVMQEVMNKKALITYASCIAGDVNQTRASITKAQEKLAYQPKTSVYEGIQKMFEWYVKQR